MRRAADEPPQGRRSLVGLRLLVRRSAVPGAITFLLLLAFLASGVGQGFEGVGLGDSAMEALQKVCFTGSDACHYLTAGRELLETGTLANENRWILNLWPPGVVVVSALYVWLAGSGLPLSVVVGAVGILVWAAVLTMWFRYLHETVGGGLATIGILLVALGGPMRTWYLGEGLFYQESLSAACFLMCLLIALRARTRTDSSSVPWLLVGCLLAAAAYLKVIYELVGLFLTAVLILWSGAALMRFWTSRLLGSGQQRSLRQLLPLVYVVLAFQILTIPWRWFASETTRPGDWSWSQTGNVALALIWQPTHHLLDRGLGWVVEGTGNTACLVAPDECEEIFIAEMASVAPYSGEAHSFDELRSRAVHAWLGNPVQWTLIKTGAALKYWFKDPHFPYSPSHTEFHENGTYLVLLLGTLWFGSRRLGLAFGLFVALLITTMGFPYVSNFEDRFFFPIKSALPLLAASWVAPLLVPRRSQVRGTMVTDSDRQPVGALGSSDG